MSIENLKSITVALEQAQNNRVRLKTKLYTLEEERFAKEKQAKELEFEAKTQIILNDTEKLYKNDKQRDMAVKSLLNEDTIHFGIKERLQEIAVELNRLDIELRENMLDISKYQREWDINKLSILLEVK